MTNSISDWLSDLFRGRPWWMNALMVFCAFMAFVYVPWDLFWKPVAEDKEVWFGIVFSGWAAKLMALPHWFVYGAAAYGFSRMRPWMCTWAAIYSAQVAFGMFVWTVGNYGGLLGVFVGLFPAAPFALLAVLFWNEEEHFCATRPKLSERYGKWAIVTGASAGIGAEFARALAGEGVSCVLVARRANRLADLAAELEQTDGVETRCLALDLGEPDAPERISQAVSDLEISILVNNAGLGYVGRYDKQDGAKVANLIDVNCRAPALLTSAFLPGMRARGHGALIFTGSVAGSQPMPLHATYSATKAFDNFLAEALYVENRNSGVDVLVVEPGPVDTEFQQVAGEAAHQGGEHPATTVQVALDALGHQPTVVPGWFNWVRSVFAQRIAPRRLVTYVARDFTSARVPADLS